MSIWYILVTSSSRDRLLVMNCNLFVFAETDWSILYLSRFQIFITGFSVKNSSVNPSSVLPRQIASLKSKSQIKSTVDFLSKILKIHEQRVEMIIMRCDNCYHCTSYYQATSRIAIKLWVFLSNEHWLIGQSAKGSISDLKV